MAKKKTTTTPEPKPEPKPAAQPARMFGSPELVGSNGRHWSACPECGCSKLTMPTEGHTPICNGTGGREQIDGRWVIYKYMHCRTCDNNYTALQPD